jgi:hypothetical protein
MIFRNTEAVVSKRESPCYVMEAIRRFALVTVCAALVTVSSAEGKEKKFVPNYDEAKVPKYTLPDPLSPGNGHKVETKEQWESHGRQRTLGLFEKHVYGKVPAGFQPEVKWKLLAEKPDALGGLAVRRECLVTIRNQVEVRMLLYIPKNRNRPVPGFLGLNFRGNQLVEADPSIAMETGFVIGGKDSIKQNRATEASRGTGATRWPAKMIVERGYALATVCCSNIDPDFDDGFKNGVHALDKQARNDESWGTIAGWAWGLSRLLDVLEEFEEVDAKRIAVIGHSRLGKTALWAGAADSRFAMVISNNSGCGGAALSRRAVGETVERINARFPHWFCKKFWNYNENENSIPVDQHQLIALIAPRPVYVASATEDRWADPRGEFLSVKHAVPVYELYCKEPFGVEEMPKPDQPGGNLMRYHLRSGKHDCTEWDWRQYLDFADRWMKTPRSP